eukprot:CAMPEP_0205825578 /NCGR_PEP_ID=MMETSP0206-20130828/25748_1 /ASSEMBLY_ACC=CAM_ASM_000279 /TAXON_ID=36767 /ORGANISM="Euplotes focardii, Strain TN1" /LENGTH=97 /DNA_ID=CAMNT_0053124743 /DNA_START=46 /DNA_END=336 /DNA_ORIENTATION=-
MALEEPPKDESPTPIKETPEPVLQDNPVVDPQTDKNDKMGSTFPAQPHNDYNNFDDQNDFPQSQTQQNFNPKTTFHARSTDRGAGRMQNYARISSNW